MCQLLLYADEVDEIAAEAADVRVKITLFQAKISNSIETSELLNFADISKRFLALEEFPGYPALNSLSGALKRVFQSYAGKLSSPPTVAATFVTTANKASVNDPVVETRRLGILGALETLGHLAGGIGRASCMEESCQS